MSGSRARGDALKHCNLDLLIVSAAFGGISWLDGAPRVVADCGSRFGVELLCYKPAQYSRRLEEWRIVRTARGAPA